MTVSEFGIIDRFFNQPALTLDAGCSDNLPLGIGDDCALISVASGQHLAVTMDILGADVHFPAKAPADLIAMKAMAVNLSDLAAMGARPVGITLGLCLPEVNESWLTRFSEGLARSIQRYQCPLIGGDITKGPLSITISAHGSVTAGSALTRSGARAGDLVYVSGSLGAAGLALEMLSDSLQLSPEDVAGLSQAYYQPEPRLALGRLAAGLASAAIDISDGLLADLEHVTHKSSVSMRLRMNDVPVSPLVTRILAANGRGPESIHLALTAGDDYELALTVPPENASAFEALAGPTGVNLTRVGRVLAGSGVICEDDSGTPISVGKTGYQHFTA